VRARSRSWRGLRFEKRRADWRLGRFASKAAVAIWLGVPPGRVELAAAPDGAPEAWLDGRRAPASLSLSHRAGRALAVVGPSGHALGCVLELVEPRSRAFLNDCPAPSERGLVASRARLVMAVVGEPAPGRPRALDD
jgi:4'-phosphopantetheinyl transferase EntD